MNERDAATSSPSNPVREPEDIAFARLQESLMWYRSKSGLNKSWYQSLRCLTIFSAVLIPFLSTNSNIPAGHQVAAVLGVLIAAIEGLQQIKQFHENWVNYRATEEALKHEQYLYLAKAGPFRGSGAPAQLLAERVEALVGSEESKWMSMQSSSGPLKQP